MGKKSPKKQSKQNLQSSKSLSSVQDSSKNPILDSQKSLKVSENEKFEAISNPEQSEIEKIVEGAAAISVTDEQSVEDEQTPPVNKVQLLKDLIAESTRVDVVNKVVDDEEDGSQMLVCLVPSVLKLKTRYGKLMRALVKCLESR